ncbi:MAG: DUF5658 family protein [Phycisphaerales bacterium]
MGKVLHMLMGRRRDLPTPQTLRAWRVIGLVTVVAITSCVDLYLTLMYLYAGGFAEGNPLARWIMQFGCPWVLGLWKLMLVVLCCSILLYARRRFSAELAAWICCGVMGWLCVQWSRYAEAAPTVMEVRHTVAEADTPWVQFSP